LDLELSPLSDTKGLVDIYWDIPGGLAAEKPKRAIATPLDLVDGIKIINNTNKQIILNEISNENPELLNILPEEYREKPIILLPEKFIKNDREEILCKNRNLFDSSLNNICIFETPLVIAPKEQVILRPQLFAVPGGLWAFPPFTRDIITFFDWKNKDKNLVFVTIPESRKKYLYLSNKFQSYESTKTTFHIGGFILVNSKDENFINKVFNFKTIEGEKINAKINSITTGLTIKSFELPEKSSEAEKNKFNEDVLTMQVFLYRNNFLNLQDINGKYDNKTITAIKKLQRNAGIVETGKFDDATVFVTRAFDTGISLYENYADEIVTVSFDTQQPYFRMFSGGTSEVYLNKDFSSSSLIVGQGFFPLYEVRILNNTSQTKQCFLFNPSNIAVKSFSINPNGIYSLRLQLKGLTEPTIHHLQCGDKKMDIEMVPE
jgi:hypothetical protein